MKQSGKARFKLNIICVLLLAVVLLLGGTFAYFYDDDSVRSKFATGEYDTLIVRLIEPAWQSPEQGLGSVPGDNIPADPTIVNLEDPAYMRVRITLRDLNNSSRIKGERAEKIWKMIRFADTSAEQQAVKSAMTEAQMNQSLPNHINASEFVYDDVRSDENEGIYYFNYIGGTGKSYAILMTDQQATLYNYVIVPFDWTSEEIKEIGNFVVEIQGEALHAENYQIGETEITSAEQAFELIHNAMSNK